MRILLTGSSGWLGRHLAPLLAQRGHAVDGLDVAPGPHTNFVASVSDAKAVGEAFAQSRPEGVIHAAALHKPDIARESEHEFVKVNITGTLNLLAAARAAGCARFVHTSTTSLMISQAVRDERAGPAAWLDEGFGPLEPRNIYGMTKLAAEHLCRPYAKDHGLPLVILRTSRFFPEEDDTERDLPGANLKANELLHRRLTATDAALAHLVALERAPDLAFGLFIVSAPPPFAREDAAALWEDAAGLIAARFPDAPSLYARRGWRLPTRIDRVYDPSAAERALGFRCRTDFAALLGALRDGAPHPFDHDPAYISPRLGPHETR